MSQANYLFIDAENLNMMLRKICTDYGGSSPVINWENIGRPYRKVFYYDALPPRRKAQNQQEFEQELNKKKAELSEIERLPRFHVRSGVTRHRQQRNEQKMVDILLAVDALTMANRRLFENATLITSDLDFEPLVRELVNSGIEVTLIHSASGTNEELISAADISTPLTLDFLVGQNWISSVESGMSIPKVDYAYCDEEWLVGEILHEERCDENGFSRLIRIGEDLIFEGEHMANGFASRRVQIKSPSRLAIESYLKDKLGRDISGWLTRLD